MTEQALDAQRTMSLRSHRVVGVRRSQGVAVGLLVLLLGAWGAVIPFVGPKVHYAFGTYATFHFTWERVWLSVLPGAAAFLGGALLISAASRSRALLGAALAAAAGIWFAVGVPLSTLWRGAGRVGIGPALGGDAHRAAESIGYFYGLGAAIIFLAALSIGRLSVVSARDARAADERAEEAAERAGAEAAVTNEAGATGAASEHADAVSGSDGQPPSEAAPRSSEHAAARADR